ncbi:hypothetical protein Cgig2_027024 [Carnegiea gigantea]|uniref:Uncharacterized protein n=1 Tax=Carnegiea gigantea TaxID=171969 RepID=A0A9Q1KA32_9CARY|nr:hypothetical protein Cgig2_027024 [Carnegiea gigantea]
MVSAQNLISDASTHKYTATFSCYGDGGTGSNVGLPADALMTAPSLPSDAYGFALTYPNTNGAATNNNSEHDNNNKVLGRSGDNRSILSLGAGNSIIGCNYHRDWHHNHNKCAIMAESEGEGEHQLVVVQGQCSSRTCNSINGGLSSSSNKPTRDEHQRGGEGREEEEEGSWLQLGIGSRGDQHNQDESTAENMASGNSSIRTAGSTGLLRLDLNLGGGGGVYSDVPLPGRHPPTPNSGAQNQNQNQPAWGFIRGNHQYPMAMAARPASSNSSPSPPALLLMAPPPPNLLLGPHHHHAHAHADTNSTLIRVIDPPPRTPHSGIWFMLLASHPQAKEPFLPQLPKRFLRIKDGRMTVRLVMKYVANKLGLDSESEVTN